MESLAFLALRISTTFWKDGLDVHTPMRVLSEESLNECKTLRHDIEAKAEEEEESGWLHRRH